SMIATSTIKCPTLAGSAPARRRIASSAPAARRWARRCEPRKPVAPVITALIVCPLSGHPPSGEGSGALVEHLDHVVDPGIVQARIDADPEVPIHDVVGAGEVSDRPVLDPMIGRLPQQIPGEDLPGRDLSGLEESVGVGTAEGS